MISGVDKWYTVTKTLRDQINADLQTAVDRVSIVPGTIAWDACDCGALYLSVGNVYLSETFPDQRTVVEFAGDGGCEPPYEVGEIIVQIMRCAPIPTGQNVSPTVTQLDVSAQLVRRDAYSVLKSLSTKLCAMETGHEIVSYIIDLQTPAGPQGGCVGTETRVRVGLLRN